MKCVLSRLGFGWQASPPFSHKECEVEIQEFGMGFLHLNVYLCVFLPWPTLGPQTSFPLCPPPPSIPVPFRYHCLDFYFPPWMQLPATNLPCAAISFPLSIFFRSLQTHTLSGSNTVSSQFENRVTFLLRSPRAGERDALVDVLAPSAPS